MLDIKNGVDIIGDIHGCYWTLCNLLTKLGYQEINGVWQHNSRIAIFLGDLVDRGNFVRESLHLVHKMTQANKALCILGNHEQNALEWFTKDANGDFVREHNFRNEKLFQQTLEQFANHPEELEMFLEWFQTLPLYLDFDNFRVAHAAYDKDKVDLLNELTNNTNCLDRNYISQLTNNKSRHRIAVSVFLRGVEIKLPIPHKVIINGTSRTKVRSKFWCTNPKNYKELLMPQGELKPELANLSVAPDKIQEALKHTKDDKILFVGHYWFLGDIKPIMPNLACLDYSAIAGNKLVAYRFDNESSLDINKFISVSADERDTKKYKASF